MTSERWIALSRSSQRRREYPTLQAKHSGLKVVLKGILKHWNIIIEITATAVSKGSPYNVHTKFKKHGEESLICTLIDELSSPEAAVLHQLKDD